jgi:hypothetical protein
MNASRRCPFAGGRCADESCLDAQVRGDRGPYGCRLARAFDAQDGAKTPDAYYERLVQGAGLYGQAFFGHKAAPKERATLRRLWQRARRLAEAR